MNWEIQMKFAPRLCALAVQLGLVATLVGAPLSVSGASCSDPLPTPSEPEGPAGTNVLLDTGRTAEAYRSNSSSGVQNKQHLRSCDEPADRLTFGEEAVACNVYPLLNCSSEFRGVSCIAYTEDAIRLKSCQKVTMSGSKLKVTLRTIFQNWSTSKAVVRLRITPASGDWVLDESYPFLAHARQPWEPPPMDCFEEEILVNQTAATYFVEAELMATDAPPSGMDEPLYGGETENYLIVVEQTWPQPPAFAVRLKAFGDGGNGNQMDSCNCN